ncbi:hypothetical protein GDO78_010850 [Eleutherodactylus coqui]|uniref:Uncharacterized protein n=1 Tax=Eleutherodactylus coqui TaxID=57060 RepID=A0A8J6F796_ELECQ|nr:hypothetical protein GDO78_010850 [Eleutherodactylus coqui]
MSRILTLVQPICTRKSTVLSMGKRAKQQLEPLIRQEMDFGLPETPVDKVPTLELLILAVALWSKVHELQLRQKVDIRLAQLQHIVEQDWSH